MSKLSIIVPVYNVASCLRKCVDSLLEQDYPDCEIILVDDGSTDGSGAICDEIVSRVSKAHRDSKDSIGSKDINDIKDAKVSNSVVIRVIHQPNAGLSAARNTGIAAARGKFIMFVDSDDYIEPNVLGALMAQVEREQLDVLHFDYQNVRMNAAGQYEVFQPNKFPHPVDKRTDVVSGERYLAERMGYGCYACHFVINREVTGTFTPGIHFEDTEWLPRMMLAAKRVNATIKVVYNYFMRDGSITQVQGDSAKLRKNLEDCMTVIARYNRYMEDYPRCAWLKNMQGSMVVSVIAGVAQYFYAERKDFISRLKSLGVFPLTIANQGQTYVRKALLINLSPWLTVELLHRKNGK